MGNDNKNTVGLRVRNVYYPQIPARSGLADSDPRAFLPWPILASSTQHFYDFCFINSMVINMRLTRLWVKIKANIHALAPVWVLFSGARCAPYNRPISLAES